MSALDDVLRDLVVANRILADHGVLDAFGHVSIRHPDNSERYFMSCSRGPSVVSRDDLMEFDLDSEPIDQRGRAMYAERQIHGRAYRARPDINSVCHNHSAATIPFGTSDVPLRPIFHMGSVVGRQVPVWDIADDFGPTDLLVTTPAMGASLAAALGNGRVVLMRGHGSSVVGRTLREVVFTSVYLQKNAELSLAARNLTNVRFLSDEEIDLAAAMLFQPLSQNRAWEDWTKRLGTMEDI